MLYAIFNINSTFGQNYIKAEEASTAIGNIYHTGGNLGIGTTSPEKELSIYAQDNTTFRIEEFNNIGEVYYTYWDFVHSTNLHFQYGTNLEPMATQMILTTTGQLALGTEIPHESAIFQADATDKGILIPRLTSSQIIALTPTIGLLVYNTTAQTFSFYNGTQWTEIAQDKQFDDYLLESDFNAHPASDITTENITDWQATYTEINNLIPNTLLYNDATGNLQSISPNGTEGQILTTNGNGNYTWALPQSQAETFWLHTSNSTYLKNENDNVGIGLPKGIASYAPIHIIRDFTDAMPERPACIRLENIQKGDIAGNKYTAWEIINREFTNNLNINSISSSTKNTPTLNLFTFSNEGYFGIGTETPETNLHIATFDETQNTTLRMQKRANSGGTKNEYESVWDMEVAGNTLEFKYAEAELNSQNPTTETMMTISNNQVSANTFVANTLKTNEVNFDNKFKIESELIENNHTIKFYSTYPFLKTQINIGGTEEEPAVVIDRDGNLGIGTSEPAKPIHIKGNEPLIRIENMSSSVWDIENSGGKLNFKYAEDGRPTENLFTFTRQGRIGIGTTEPTHLFSVNNKFMVDDEGNATATFFHGDGSNLTNLPIPETVWLTNDEGIYYNEGQVKIIKDYDILLGDNNNRLGWYGEGKEFANYQYNIGTVLYGNPGGALGGYFWVNDEGEAIEQGIDGGHMEQRLIMRWKWHTAYFGTPEYIILPNFRTGS